MEALGEVMHWLAVAINQRCTGSRYYSQQCERTDTVVIAFSDKYMDWVKACPGHVAAYEHWRDGPLKKIRTGR